MPTNVFTGDDLKLAECVKERDLQCLIRLYDKFGAALLGIIYRITANEKLAEEILSAVFIEAWNRTNDFFTCGTSLFTWLLKIARESTADAVRREEQANPGGNNNVHTAKRSTGEISTGDRPLQMAAFDSVYYKGLSLGEAAAALGKSVAELKVDLINTIKGLRDKKVA